MFNYVQLKNKKQKRFNCKRIAHIKLAWQVDMMQKLNVQCDAWLNKKDSRWAIWLSVNMELTLVQYASPPDPKGDEEWICVWSVSCL